MGGLESSRDVAPESRDTLMGNISTPFELRELTQKSVPYAPVFMESLSKNWEKVCELMNWKTNGQTMDVSIFNLAKDPVVVVKSIQETIVAKGGKLDKYGQDGKFGAETETALKTVLSPVSRRTDEEPQERITASKKASALAACEAHIMNLINEEGLDPSDPSLSTLLYDSAEFLLPGDPLFEYGNTQSPLKKFHSKDISLIIKVPTRGDDFNPFYYFALDANNNVVAFDN